MFLATGSAQAAASDPLFVFIPSPPPPPAPAQPPPLGYLNGPCGLGVDSQGDFYVSDYYHDTVDRYDGEANYAPGQVPPVSGATGFLGALPFIDPFDGPCQLAFDASNDLYVNDYHRAVIKYSPSPSFGAGTVITGTRSPSWAGVGIATPTGVAVDPASGDVYVDQRTHVSVFDPGGSELEQIGSFEDGYGLAISSYPGTAGYLYVPDAATNTVKVYDPATSKANPVATIDGSGTPNGKFVSLRDASIAVDRVTGEVYVIDDLQPEYTEKPKAIVYVFSAAGAYEGHLKFQIVDALPSGLAVDNTTLPSQGRVYVNSGNTISGSIYAYPPGAATKEAPKSSSFTLALRSTGAGAGALSVPAGALQCESACSADISSGATVSVSADPAPGSAFAGWSGACSGDSPTCTVQMDEAASVQGAFTQTGGPEASPPEPTTQSPAPSTTAATKKSVRPRAHRRRHHHHKAHRTHRRGVKANR